MLAMWTMHEAGLDVPIEAVEKTLTYLKSTIDPSGGWGYEGIISAGAPVRQDRLSKSLATAGVGAVLIAGDMLGFFRHVRRNDAEDAIPDALVRVDQVARLRADRKSRTLSRSDLEPLVEAAQKYQKADGFTGGFFDYYWQYSQERYEIFLEIM